MINRCLALCVAFVMGCGATAEDGTFPCTEQGVRDAIAEGGGPHIFACDAPTPVTADFMIDNDVILDGRGALAIGSIEVLEGVVVELRGIEIGRGVLADSTGVINRGTLRMVDSHISRQDRYGLINSGSVTLIRCQVTRNGGGVISSGTLEAIDTTISGNATGADNEDSAAGLDNLGTARLRNCTVSSNVDRGARGSGGIYNAEGGRLTATNVTLSNNQGADAGALINAGTLRVAHLTLSGNMGAVDIRNEGDAQIRNSVVEGDCEGDLVSGGYNVESPGTTCDLTAEGDQDGIASSALGLEPLADNGGLTETQALAAGSPALAEIPGDRCLDAEGEPLTEDQRGEPRPTSAVAACDVGAFEAP